MPFCWLRIFPSQDRFCCSRRASRRYDAPPISPGRWIRVKLDENLPLSAKQVLVDRGYDVDTVADEGLAGAADPTLVAETTAANRLLITLDRGPGDLRHYRPAAMPGSSSCALQSNRPPQLARL
jgi:hypothetical protein